MIARPGQTRQIAGVINCRCPRHIILLAALVLSMSAGVADAQIRMQVYASGFSAPVGFVQDPTDPAIHLVIEQAGRIRVVRNGATLPTDFLDLRGVVGCCGERGLLGLAFAPDYATSRRFFVNYTNPTGDTVVSRYKRSIANPLVADPSTRFDLRWASLPGAPSYIPHPFEYGNHNGGNIAFGPDSYLYIGMGDGGSANDPNNWAQTPGSLLGKMLRIDVSVPDTDPQGYRVPTSNPFLGPGSAGTLPEIWDFGLRNPWRFSFDYATGALVIADVGQGSREEIDYEPAARGGNNYGWRIREGTLTNIPGTAAFLPLTDPIYEYDHTVGFSITGGFVYRGTGLSPAFQRRYFFADFVAGRIWSLGLKLDSSTRAAVVTDVVEHTGELGGPAVVGSISSFGMDWDGELYVVQYSGTIQKLVAPTAPTRFLAVADFTADGRPDLLSQSLNGNVTLTLNPGFDIYNTVDRIYDDFTAWKVVGIADLNHDDHPDLLWQGPDGSVVSWLLVQTGVLQYQLTTLYGGTSVWRVVAVIDLDGDGDADLVWQSPTGQVVVWLMRQGTLLSVQTLWPYASDWRVVGAGDFNGDGDADLLWQGPTGALVTWTMHGTSFGSSQYLFTGDTVWRVIGVGDYDGDGKPDILWRSPTDQVVVWIVTGVSGQGATYRTFYLNRFGVKWELATTPQPGG